MGFAWPWVFLLLPLPLLVAQWLRGTDLSDQSIALPPNVAYALTHAGNQSRSISPKALKIVLLAISWLSLLTAIAQPYSPQPTAAVAASGRSLALLIDLSTSMERKDFSIDSEPVDRLTVVKKIASQFIAARSGDRLGLVLFGSEAFIASPLSYDAQAVDSVLQSSGIGMAGRTTAMGDALGLAIKSLRDDPAPGKAVVLLSDGTSNAGVVEPEDAAKLAASLGIVVHTIGLGSDASTDDQQQFQSASADLDEATLQSIATLSGGRFFRARTTDELEQIYTEIDAIESSESSAPPLVIKKDYRNGFIVAFLFALLLVVLINTGRERYA